MSMEPVGEAACVRTGRIECTLTPALSLSLSLSLLSISSPLSSLSKQAELIDSPHTGVTLQNLN